MRLELRQLREAVETYTSHEAGTHGVWPGLVWERRSLSPLATLDDAVEFLGKWKALCFKGGRTAFRRILPSRFLGRRRSLNYAVARGIVEQPLYGGRTRWGYVDRLVRRGAVVGPTVEGNVELPERCCGVDSDEFEGHGLTRFDVEGSRCIVNRVDLVAVV